jgi:hypothetical protein
MNYICAWCHRPIPDKVCNTASVSHGLCAECAVELKKEFHSSALMRAIAEKNEQEEKGSLPEPPKPE